MHNPTDTIEFWKQRIENAKKYPKFHIVYSTIRSDWNKINRIHKKILTYEIEPTDMVLDAGCGYGRWAKHFEKDKYLGIDFSPDLIEMARKENKGYKFINAELKDMPFDDLEFDVAFCVSIKKMIIGNSGHEVWKTIEKELKRVAKKILILEYTDPLEYEIL